MTTRRERTAPPSPGIDPGLAGETPPVAPWALTAFLRRLRLGLERSGDLAQSLTAAAAGAPASARSGVDFTARRLSGHYSEDDWGLDEEFTDAALPLLEVLYRRWWRVKVTGIANVPGHGRALLVANHAGILPWDATMLGVSIMREHPLPRYARFLVHDWVFGVPYLSVALRKLGSVPASPYNALRLLEQDELVGVFPEGARGSAKPFRERYRLQRFGRGAFVELALRTGAPIVPVAVVGSEEIYPKLAELPMAAGLVGAPSVPLTPTFPALGPLGAMPLPSKWRIRFCEPIETVGYGSGAADDRTLVLRLSEQVREAIQRAVYSELVARGSAFL